MGIVCLDEVVGGGLPLLVWSEGIDRVLPLVVWLRGIGVVELPLVALLEVMGMG
jgi:hypothetical protein